MDPSHAEADQSCRRVAQRAFVTPARTAVSEKEYDKALRLMAAGAVIPDDPSFLLDAASAPPHRFALWRSALRAVQETPSLILHGGTGPRCLAFTADGKRVVGGGFRAVRVWDVATGAEVAVYPFDRNIVSAALSTDGVKVITGYQNGDAEVWEAQTGRVIAELKSNGPGPAYSVAFTPDGKRILLGAPTGIYVWDAETGASVEVWTNPIGWYADVAFSEDRTRVLTGFYKNQAIAWYLETGEVIAELNGHTEMVVHVALAAGSTRAITGSHDETARVWDLATGNQIALFRGRVDHVALSPDGTRALTGLGKIARLWDVQTGEEMRTWQVPGSVSAFAFYPDGKRALVGSYPSTYGWDTTRGDETAILRGHKGSVVKALFSADGTRAITGSDDRTARVWDVATGSKIAVLRGHEVPVIDVAFNPDGSRALTASARDARLWDSQTGKQLAVLCAWEEPLDGVVFNSDGTRLAVWNKDKTARVLDAATGSEIAVLRGHEAAVWSAAFSPDGSRLVTGAFDRTARVWDVSSGAEILQVKDPDRGQGGTLAAAAFSRDARWLLTCFFAWFPLPRPELCGEDVARIWDLASGKETAVLNHPLGVGEFPQHATALRDVSIHRGKFPAVLCGAFRPDGVLAITGSDDRAARLWDATAGAEIASLRGHEGSVMSVAFSPDGSRVLTGSDDRTARLWDVSRWSAFNGDRAVYLAAALDGGLGRRGEAEREDLLMQNAPDDLFAALMERLTPEQRALVPETSRRLRIPLDPNCYRPLPPNG